MSTAVGKAAGDAATFVDERVGTNMMVKKNLRKIFPEHWTFMLGEIALYSFIILLLTGTFLTLFYNPSTNEVFYNGSYVPLRGVKMSEAYESTLNISFDVRGGLIMRQIHHWAALVFVSAISVHLLRIFFTGAFRKPREFNWLIGNVLLLLAIIEGFLGYSLPDDLLSGTGLRITSSIVLAVPVVGTYISMFMFGGEFPGNDFVGRIYSVHILLIPGIILALITVHLLLVVWQKHTQFPGPGRTEKNVVGYPLLPVYMAKAGGFFFVVFGVCALLGGLAQINPIWLYGPYNPAQVSAGSQPDWYMGFLDGAVRTGPNWEISAWGHTLSLNLIIPAMVVPGLMLTPMLLYPFIESWITGDKREHHLLDRPRNVPTRTGLGVMALVFYGLLWLNGGNDIIATRFDLSINQITWFVRIALFVLPPLAFVATKRICLSLQRRDADKVLHGRETGIIRRLPNGEYTELHAPISAEERYKLTVHEIPAPPAIGPARDENGVPARGAIVTKVRAKLHGFYFGDHVDKPTREEYAAITSGHDSH